MTEFGFIDHIKELFAALPDNGFEGIGDDCAVLPVGEGESLVFTTDMLAEGVHFLRPATSPRELGRKSLAVNLSDVASMGARPVGTLLSLSLPADTAGTWAEEFMLGYRELSEAFGVTLAGGDTTLLGGRHHDQCHGHRPHRRRTHQAPQRGTPRRRDTRRRRTRTFGRRAARHPRRALRHPRRRSPPQPAAPSGRRHLARRTPRNTRHDGPLGRAGLGHPPHHGAFGGRRRDRHRPYPPCPKGADVENSRLRGARLQAPAHGRHGGRRQARRRISAHASARRSTPSATSRTATNWSGSKTADPGPWTGTGSRITDRVLATATTPDLPSRRKTAASRQARL